MEIIPIGISEVIRAELGRKKMNFAALAEATGISYDSILRKVGHESRDFRMGEVQAIAEALELPLLELMRRAEEAEKTRQAVA